MLSYILEIGPTNLSVYITIRTLLYFAARDAANCAWRRAVSHLVISPAAYHSRFGTLLHSVSKCTYRMKDTSNIRTVLSLFFRRTQTFRTQPRISESHSLRIHGTQQKKSRMTHSSDRSFRGLNGHVRCHQTRSFSEKVGPPTNSTDIVFSSLLTSVNHLPIQICSSRASKQFLVLLSTYSFLRSI